MSEAQTQHPEPHEPAPGGDPRLEAHKDWLVEKGDEIGKKARDNKYWKSQIRGLLEAARTETHPGVLENLLRYQAARNDNWQKPRDVMTPLLNGIADCEKKAGDDVPFAMELICHLLLYTLRAHTFAEKFPDQAARAAS